MDITWEQFKQLCDAVKQMGELCLRMDKKIEALEKASAPLVTPDCAEFSTKRGPGRPPKYEKRKLIVPEVTIESYRKFATIDDWCTISGMSRRVTYEKLGTGELKAIKVGSRTLIDVEHGLAWLRTLASPVILPPRPRL